MANMTVIQVKLPTSLLADIAAEAVERKVALDALIIEALEDALASPEEDEGGYDSDSVDDEDDD